ncbi:ORF6N domain-containing protein [Escherichia coli]
MSKCTELSLWPLRNFISKLFSPITHNQIPVITTELLAQLSCCNQQRELNLHRNSERFVEGKHFFKVVGDELKILQTLKQLTKLQPVFKGLQISPKARSLILWTKRGAARSTKMLETDQAWEVLEKLEAIEPVREKYWQTKKLNGLYAKETDVCMAVGLC